MRPECFGNRHLHLATFGQRGEHALGFFDAVDVDIDGGRATLATAGAVGRPHDGAADLQLAVRDVVQGFRRHLVATRRAIGWRHVAVLHLRSDLATECLGIERHCIVGLAAEAEEGNQFHGIAPLIDTGCCQAAPGVE
ncbi:hypothetical protein G6F68_017171 [Rhizopus microsporus]|nr:hypothetical protein G6F68_017171 [Rhizopus microsporus]